MNSEAEPVVDPHCPFCAIASGKDQDAEFICEGATWVSFFPPEPAMPGHTLVIPRMHVPDLWSLRPSQGGDLLNAVVLVGRAIDAALGPDGLNLISSSGAAAGQTVFHLHLHIVPRWENDDFGNIWPPKKRMEGALAEDLADAIREQCRT